MAGSELAAWSDGTSVIIFLGLGLYFERVLVAWTYVCY